MQRMDARFWQWQAIGLISYGLLLWLVQLVIFAGWQVAWRPQRPMIQTVEVELIKTVR